MELVKYSALFKSELQMLFSEKELQNHLYILFQHYLDYDRAQVVLRANEQINETALKKLTFAIEELKKSKPIDYVINNSVFFGRDFYVDESVLIPRSETEELVQWILEEMDSEDKSILDIGSGSGCIPITLQLEGNFALVDAIEISEMANVTAQRNAKELNAKVDFKKLDILSEIPEKKYDIVVSNPPYVKEEELENLDKNVVEYEPLVALAPIGDPLTFYRRMIEIAPDILKKGSVFFWEIHEDLGAEVLKLLNREEFSNVELKQDIYGRDRLVKATYF